MTLHVERRRLESFAASDWAPLAGESFFGSHAFVDAWRHAGGSPVAWLVERASRPAALLPGVEYGATPFARFASLPDGCYGGLLVEPAHEGDRAHLGQAVLAAIARHGYAKACVFDFEHTLTGHPEFVAQREVTRVIPLTGPGWQPAEAKLRSQVRRAAREGIRVERFAWTRHQTGFLQLVFRSAHQHGRQPRHGYAFYEALARIAEHDSRVRWYWCEHEGRPVASHLYFVERGGLFAWQTHFDRAWSRLKPNPYIRQLACAEAAADGVTRLNLGCTPPGADGLAYYKSRWGGEVVTYPSWYRWQGLGALAKTFLGAGQPPPAVPAWVRVPETTRTR